MAPKIVAIVVAVLVSACSMNSASVGTATAGFWYERETFLIPADVTDAITRPLMPDEMAAIVRVSRTEVERAFANLRITLTESPPSFWRVTVTQTLPIRNNRLLPRVGESLALGPLGGVGSVDFDIIVLKAVRYAPAGATRRTIIDGIGRGIGRAAVHELFHQIAGVAVGDNLTDENSYEYGSPDRASQYYGELHWSTAWPVLVQKFGK
jgi:hypothetical protein